MVKKCLFITSQFPPLVISGCKRTAGVSKYLARQGWEMIVITPEDGYVPYLDSNRDFIPQGVRIMKTKVASPRVYREMKRTTNIFKLAVPWMLKRVLIPDRLLAWFPYAYCEAKKIIDCESIDILYSTGEYFSSHIIAMILQKKTNIPWIAEFRDPWSSNPLVQRRNAIRKFSEKRLERAVVHAADIILSVTPHLTNELMSIHPQERKEKFFTIPNGFDHESYEYPPSIQHKTFTICYAGTIRFREKKFQVLLVALKNLIREKKIDPKRIIINLWGWRNHLAVYQSILRKWGLEKTVFCRESLSFTEMIREEQKSHILLFLDNDEMIQVSVPAKLYEYLGSKRPILALTHTGSFAYNILTQARVGEIVSTITIEATEHAIYSLYSEYYRSGSVPYNPNTDIVSRYRYATIAQDVDTIFCSLLP